MKFLRSLLAAIALMTCLVAPAYATFAVVASTNTSSSAAAQTTAVVALPATIASGDLLIFCMAFGSISISTTTPAGWTQVFNDSIATGGESGSCEYKVASGSEGASVSVTITSSRWSAISWRITGFDSGTAPAVSTRSSAASATQSPPALTPSWGALDTLWIVADGHASANPIPTTSTYPTNYTSNQIDNASGNTTNDAVITSATRTANTATETPGSFTLSASKAGSAYTLGIRPTSSTSKLYPINIPMIGM